MLLADARQHVQHTPAEPGLPVTPRLMRRSKGEPLQLETLRHMLTVFQTVDRVHESLASLLDCLHLGLVRRWLPDSPHKTAASSSCLPWAAAATAADRCH